MTCSLERPSLQNIFNRQRDMFSTTVLNGSPIIPESNEWYVVALNAAMVEEFYAITEQQWKERDPRYACCDNLYKLAAAEGIYPRTSKRAEGYVKLLGTAGSVLPSTIEVILGTRNYRSIGVVPTTMPQAGEIIINVRAVEGGVEGNSDGVVTTGTLASAIAGVDRTVEVCGGMLCGGEPAEDCEAFRRRYLDRKTYQPRATATWLKNKILEWPCATRVLDRAGSCCGCGDDCLDPECKCVSCGDNMEFYVMFDNSFPCGIPPESVVAQLNQWVFGEHAGYGEGLVEIGVCGRIVQPIADMVNIRVDIEDCPTAGQQNQIENDIIAFMKTIAPSQPIRMQQIELIVANVMGGAVNTSARMEQVTPNREAGYINDCGDYYPECDYLPCLNEVTFTKLEGGLGCA